MGTDLDIVGPGIYDSVLFTKITLVVIFPYSKNEREGRRESAPANSHFPRPAGPHFPASQGHIKRSALEIGRARGAPPC